jgi:hypothetical protein
MNAQKAETKSLLNWHQEMIPIVKPRHLRRGSSIAKRVSETAAENYVRSDYTVDRQREYQQKNILQKGSPGGQKGE